VTSTPVQRGQAYAVHLLTASGAVLAFLAAFEVARPQPDPRRVFLWLALAVIVDAVDGPLARAWQVKVHVPHVDGRRIDDIVDYMTFTFVPLLLVARLRWVPDPVELWIAPALMASVLGFANTGAKQEADGFFLGWPSYWNIFAFYAGLWTQWRGPLLPGLVLLVLTVLTLAPVRFVYPNLAPPGWRWPMIGGAWLWTVILAAMLPAYPANPLPLVAASLVYPAFYLLGSFWLDLKSRKARGRLSA
jgi:phosphatidylcholine synthase